MTTVEPTEGPVTDTAASTLLSAGIPAPHTGFGRWAWQHLLRLLQLSGGALVRVLPHWLTRRYTYEERWSDPLHILVVGGAAIGLALVVGGYILFLMANGYLGAWMQSLVP